MTYAFKLPHPVAFPPPPPGGAEVGVGASSTLFTLFNISGQYLMALYKYTYITG